jgi:hypothetical protein
MDKNPWIYMSVLDLTCPFFPISIGGAKNVPNVSLARGDQQPW